jgi:DNA-binding transcriptional LysR family regulator
VLLEGADEEIHEWISSDLVDVGFSVIPAPHLQGQMVATDEMLLVVPRSHRLASQSTISLAQIVDEPFLMPKAGCELLIRDLFRHARIPAPKIVLEVFEMTTLIALVREGLGITIVPQLPIVPEPEGITTLKLNPPALRYINLLYKPGHPKSLIVRAFIEEVVH